MKKIFLLLIALLSFGQLYADDYLPMVREGVKWVYFLTYKSVENSSSKVIFISYEFKDEVEMNGKTYKKCWRTIKDKSGTFDTTPTVIAYAREEDKKVYAIYDESFIAKNRDFSAGYHEYGITYNGEMTMQDIGSGYHEMLGNKMFTVGYFYPDYCDEYLIYDFNDVEKFYSRYPKKLYLCDPIEMYEEQYDNVPNTIFTESYDVTNIGDAGINNRQLQLYVVYKVLKKSFENSTHFTPASESNAPKSDVSSIWEGIRSRLLVPGYGVLTLERGQTLNKRSVIACMNKSFMSPDAVMRHIDASIFSIAKEGGLSFGFCHVEENGEKIIRYKHCSYFHGLDVDNQNVGINDIDDEITDMAGGIYYDLQGRRIAEPTQPGIYIRDGKKVIVN